MFVTKHYSMCYVVKATVMLVTYYSNYDITMIIAMVTFIVNVTGMR